jgi:hypothetical protein
MKATLEFNLPEEQSEHLYALKGVDALLVIEDLLNEIRSLLNHDGGSLSKWRDEDGILVKPDYTTVEIVRDVLIELKQERQLPELI